MARTRLIKPSFFLNDTLQGYAPHARLLFIGLWCLADREGRLEDRPERIKAQIFPYERVGVDKLLTSLHDGGFIVRYESENARYIQVVNFLKHQTPHVKEQASTIPAPTQTGACTGLAPDEHLPRSPLTLNQIQIPSLDPDAVSPPPLRRDVDDGVARAMRAFEDLAGSLNKTTSDAILAELDDGTSGDWIVAACAEAATSNVRNWKYVAAVLMHWNKPGHGLRCECGKGKKNGVGETGSTLTPEARAAFAAFNAD